MFSATTGAAYQAGQPTGYAVAAAPATAAAATYGTQRAAGHDTAYQAAAAGQVRIIICHHFKNK